MTNKHDIIWLDSVDSTNEEAKRRISTLDNLSVLSVVHQTSGKGQRQNKWLSEPGENLTFSIILKSCQYWRTDDLDAHDQFTISRVTAESLVELLEIHGIQAWIKPPNDIYISDKKISGILIENCLSGSTLKHSIIGIGLNVNQTEFDPDLPNPISIRSITGSSLDIHDLLEQFMEIFIRNMNISLSSQR